MDINEIINKEIKNYLNEGYVVSDERFIFNERLTNSSFYNYSAFTTEYDSDIVESDVVITWKVSFWLTQMGIENLIIEIQKIEGTYTLQLYDKRTDELKHETPKNIQDVDWKFVVGDANLAKGGSLYITSLDFDFKTKTCRVNF